MAGRWAGIDVGGTDTKTAVLEVRPDGTVAELAHEVHPTRAERGAAAVVERTARHAADLVDRFDVQGVGIGLPGLFDPATGCARQVPNIPGPWAGRPVRDPIARAAGRPVHLVNDARAFALAESRLGAGRGLRSVVCLTLGTGLGGGLVLDGRLHLGSGDAGEIGHQVLQPGGLPCGCGNRGCAETLVAGAALLRDSGHGSVAEVWRAAEQGDERARRSVDRAIGWLAQLVANLHAVLAPDAFVVGGGIAAAGPPLFEPLRRGSAERVHFGDPASVRILPAQLGGRAGALGAALAAGAASHAPTAGSTV